MNEIGKPPALPMILHVDHQDNLKQMMSGEEASLKAKHIEVRKKFLCDNARRSIIVSHYVRLKQHLAELLTKALESFKLASLYEFISLK